MSEEARKPPVFSCGYSEQNPVYCQQCGGHEHLCRKPPLNAAGQMSAAERDRLREWVNGLMDIGWRDKGTWVSILQFPDGTYAAMNNTEILAQGKTPYEALTAYLKGKGDGAKGE